MSMASSREAVNPLRPYYKPPTIGEQTPAPAVASPANPFPRANATKTSSPPGVRYATKARDIFPDLDYRDYVNDPSPSTIQGVKELVDELLWKYASVLMSQPFEVAKTLLQIRCQDDTGRLAVAAVAPPTSSTPREAVYTEYPDSESDDEISYFTSNAPHVASRSVPRRPRSQRASSPSSVGSVPKTSDIPPHHLDIRRPDSIFDVISQLWSREAAWGVWKGSNATFLYSVLQSLLENWSRSLLSAVLNVPDLGVKDDVDRLVDIASPYPWVSLCVAAAAAVATGIVLAPLDLVRTRLILTSTSRAPRRTLSSLRNLPTWICPPLLLVPTVLHSLIHPVLTLSTPLVLRSQFLIDNQLSPTTFSVAKFATSCASLFFKLPLETVLRRGQARILTDPTFVRALDARGTIETVVKPGPYYGVVGTMYSIVSEEGSHAAAEGSGKAKKVAAKVGTAELVYRKGQGLDGLWRGWKVSWWGLVGLWTASVVGGGGEGEF